MCVCFFLFFANTQRALKIWSVSRTLVILQRYVSSFHRQSDNSLNTTCIQYSCLLPRDRQKNENERRAKGGGNKEPVCALGYFLWLIITQIRSCFLLIRSTVSLDLFKGVNMRKHTCTSSHLSWFCIITLHALLGRKCACGLVFFFFFLSFNPLNIMTAHSHSAFKKKEIIMLLACSLEIHFILF